MAMTHPQKAIVDFNQIACELENRLVTMSPAASLSMPYDSVVDYYVNSHVYGELFSKICSDVLHEELKSYSLPTDTRKGLCNEIKTAVDVKLSTMFKVADVKGLVTLTRMAAFTYLIEDVILTHEDLLGSDNVFYLDEDERYDEGSYNPPRASRAVRDVPE